MHSLILSPADKSDGPAKDLQRSVKRRGILLVAMIFGVLHVTSSFGQTSRFSEFVRGPATNPNYQPTFTIGDLRFSIPNRLLVFPWPTGQNPVPGKAVFLKLPIVGFSSDGPNSGDISHVTFGYEQAYRYLPYTMEEFAKEKDSRWTRKRVTALDTRSYAAFQDVWNEDYIRSLKIPPTALARLIEANSGQYFFVSKDESGLRHITCMTIQHTSNAYQNLRCIAHEPYRAKDYPLDSDERFPYSVDFDFPGTELDKAATVGDQIAAKIAELQIR
jgi:hypothetical protein